MGLNTLLSFASAAVVAAQGVLFAPSSLALPYYFGHDDAPAPEDCESLVGNGFGTQLKNFLSKRKKSENKNEPLLSSELESPKQAKKTIDVEADLDAEWEGIVNKPAEKKQRFLDDFYKKAKKLTSGVTKRFGFPKEAFGRIFKKQNKPVKTEPVKTNETPEIFKPIHFKFPTKEDEVRHETFNTESRVANDAPIQQLKQPLTAQETGRDSPLVPANLDSSDVIKKSSAFSDYTLEEAPPVPPRRKRHSAQQNVFQDGGASRKPPTKPPRLEKNLIKISQNNDGSETRPPIPPLPDRAFLRLTPFSLLGQYPSTYQSVYGTKGTGEQTSPSPLPPPIPPRPYS